MTSYVNANPISVGLKPKWQRINTINFYLRDISIPPIGVVFKHMDEIQEPLLQKLILCQISAL